MLKEFREFLDKFNVIPVAVGLVLALAFAPVVTSVVDVILSIIGKAGFIPDGDTFAGWTPSDIPIGAFIAAVISFLIMAWVVFMIIKSLARAGAKTDAASGPSAEEVLLTEIRDLLRAQQQ